MKGFDPTLIVDTVGRRKIADGVDDFPPLREQLMPNMDSVVHGQTTASVRRGGIQSRMPMATLKTDGQKRRFARNLAIVAGWKGGVSQRQLARIFGLPRSVIADIIEQMKELTCSA